MVSNLVELPSRVSEAEGPSRELDAEIAEALGWREIGPGSWIRPDGRQNIGVQSYTASLDVVAALIAEKLPGWAWSALSTPRSRARSCVWNIGDDDSDVIQHGNTPALALLSAALLAIHERNKSDDKA